MTFICILLCYVYVVCVTSQLYIVHSLKGRALYYLWSLVFNFNIKYIQEKFFVSAFKELPSRR